MNKKSAIIILVVLIIIVGMLIGFFIKDKINEEKINYQIEKVSDYKYFVFKSNQKYGVIDTSGKTIIDATYDKVEIPNPSKDVFICYKNEKGLAMNANNQQLFSEYNSIESIQLVNVVTDLLYEKSVLKSEKNGKYGLIDFSGKKVLNTEYDNIKGFSGIEGLFQVEKDSKVGVANLKGTVIVKPEYDTVTSDNYFNDDMKHGYIVGIKNEDGYKYGYINYKGKLIVKEEYNDISRISDINTKEGIFLIAAKNGQYGVIKNKKNIIDNEYQSIEYDKTTKVFIVQRGKNYGVADLSGNILISTENTKIEAKGEYLYVEKNNIREVYDSNGNKVDIEFNKSIIPTSNENYKITITSQENGNYYGVIDNNNKQIIDSEYIYIEYAFDQYFIACGRNGKLGVIDSNGKNIIELKYDLVQKIQGKNMIQSLLTDTNTTEVYSENMKKICEMKNATLENNNDYIKVYCDKEIKYFNSKGEDISSKELFANNKLFAACQDGKWGYVDANNKKTVSFEYDYATEFNKYGYAAVKKDDKWGAIDENGKIIAEPHFELNEIYGEADFIGEYIKVNNGSGNVYYTKDI